MDLFCTAAARHQAKYLRDKFKFEGKRGEKKSLTQNKQYIKRRKINLLTI